VQKIPESLVMKRWTKKARLDTAGHLAEYRKENPAIQSLTYRHSSLLVRVLQFVEMGDSNVESYKMAMDIIESGITALSEISKVKDGMGLGHAQEAQTEDVDNVKFDNFPQRVPRKKNERGRPTNKRDKPAYEVGSKRPRFCSICKSDSHTKQSCPDRDPATKKPRRPPSCTGCGLFGHKIQKCKGNAQELAVVANIFV